MSMLSDVSRVLRNVLQLNEEVSLDEDLPLVGSMPEFDSMAVVSVLTALEEQFGFFVDDDEIDAEVFETVGSLVRFVEQKVSS